MLGDKRGREGELEVVSSLNEQLGDNFLLPQNLAAVNRLVCLWNMIVGQLKDEDVRERFNLSSSC